MNDVEDGIRADIRSDSDILSVTNSRLTTFRTELGLGSDSNVSGLINDVKSDVSSLVILDSTGIATIANQAVDTFKTGLFGGEYDSEGEFAIAQAGLIQTATANSDGLASINQKYFVALDDGNTFTGFEVINGDSVSSFTIQANDFKLQTANQTKTPFSVTGDTVTLSNVQVTSGLNVGASSSGARTIIEDETITVHDGTRARVIIGKLS